MRVLLVEDDAMIGESIRKGLGQEGHVVDWAHGAREADAALAAEAYGLVLLDLGLPDGDGLGLLRSLRQRGREVPTVIITARDAVGDRVKGLDEGADDYVVKPFDLDELGARIRAVMRRHAGRGQPRVVHGELEVDPASREVRRRGRPVPVSAREFALLAALLERPGTVLSREQLESRLYGWGHEVASNAVEVHVHNLRKKLGEGSIMTVRGLGYRIGDPPAPTLRA
jgi:two-component system response regulator QseB